PLAICAPVSPEKYFMGQVCFFRGAAPCNRALSRCGPGQSGRVRQEMDTMNHDDILNNRAELLQEQNGDDSGSLCHDELIFALQDKHHAFSLGLSTVLQCLKMAEHEGVVPELPEGWWSRMANRYRLN
ncbi:hypothetical protein NS834_26225, partial [Pseudomonas aeruginosa]|nr:hypothetical protein [Pseudomonas aeruginosa]MCR7583152.1 hypothetical protein [Pseudomonas aeruginosa]MCR7615225.1 hypothetical protein [Pseudomonas aeruginosa]MCR7686370.1 hypothetical protein [Pseudomonas aeruginosa]MCR7853273.1 hypothetical protein [Pseudomonas aeruginosa]